MRPLLAVLLASCLAGLLASCATPTGPAAYDAFDRYEGQRLDLTGYDAVYVAPVTASQEILDRIDASPLGRRTDPVRPLSADIIEDQQEALAEEMRSALSEVATLRDAPGPGVLTVSAELTALQANRPTMAEMRATPSLDFRSVSVGDAGARVVLSEDGRRIGVIEDRAIRRNLNEPGIGLGVWQTADLFYWRVSDKLAALLT